MGIPKQNIFQKDLFLYKAQVNFFLNFIETILIFLVVYDAFTNTVDKGGFLMFSGIVLPAFTAMYFLSTSFNYTSQNGLKTDAATFTVFFNTIKNNDNIFLWRFFSYVIAPFGMLFLYPIIHTDYFNVVSLYVLFGLLVVPFNSFLLFVHNSKTTKKMVLIYVSLCGLAFLFGGELSRLSNISTQIIYGVPMFYSWLVSIINSLNNTNTKITEVPSPN